jgi:hypothetical protein
MHLSSLVTAVLAAYMAVFGFLGKIFSLENLADYSFQEICFLFLPQHSSMLMMLKE